MDDNRDVASESDERTANNTDAMRHNYRVLSEAEKAAMVELKNIGDTFLERVQRCRDETPLQPGAMGHNPGTERCYALARTKIEEAVMWAVKGLTA